MIWPLGDGPVGVWRARRRALREMQRGLAIEAGVLALDEANPLNLAKLSLRAGDLGAARHYFDLARQRIPAYVLTCSDTVDILVGLRDFDEAESFTRTGAKLFPRRPHFLEGHALIAEHRRDFAEAVRRWATVRRRFSLRPLGYVRAAGCLRELGRFDEADALLRRAMALQPEEVPAQIEYGRVAEARGDWAEAYQRWGALSARHPAGIIGAAQALHKLGRTAEAEALLTEAQPRYPIESGIPIRLARFAEDSGHTEEALNRWATVRRRFPRDPAGYAEALRLLRAQQDWAAADTVATAAIQAVPGEPWPLAEHALLAHLRQDWPEAARRWAALRAAFPARDDGYHRGAEAEAAAGQRDAATELRRAWATRQAAAGIG